MKIDLSSCTEEELWKYVASHLKSRGIDTVLVGGSVVSIYTDGAYQSGDLDFILTNFFVKNLPQVMAEIGFKKQGGRHYVHPDCSQYYVEFPSGPLGIGDDTSIIPEEVSVDGNAIKILSPTDCVKDRLASYIHFKERVGLEQAVMVARKHPVNLTSIKKWCEAEGGTDAFIELTKLLDAKA